MASGAVDLDAIMTTTLPFERLPEAVELARTQPEQLIKVGVALA